MKKSAGFSLIELIVVTAILALLGAVGFAALVDYSRSQTLKTAARDLRTNLRLTQSKAMVQEVPSKCINLNLNLNSYQLTFTSTTNYQIQPVCGGVPQAAVVQVALPQNIAKRADSDLIIPFKVITGTLDSTKTIILEGFGKPPEIITISTSGVIQ